MEEKITLTVEYWNKPTNVFDKVYKNEYSSTENFEEVEEIYNRIFDVYDYVFLIETKTMTEKTVLRVK